MALGSDGTCCAQQKLYTITLQSRSAGEEGSSQPSGIGTDPTVDIIQHQGTRARRLSAVSSCSGDWGLGQPFTGGVASPAVTEAIAPAAPGSGEIQQGDYPLDYHQEGLLGS